MGRREDPFELRVVTATDVIDATLDFDEYPHRYLFVQADTGLGVLPRAMARLLVAVEILEGESWELVNVLNRSGFYAVMRSPRRANG
ncbi:hypothetical protein [Dactylosporangium sp. NPDC005555]|uniref:hypothetical protein n=1 Tax=Dactylosporangium sp. NPDC005555 TaxID=3154889 RepID=UPI0033A7421B